MRKPFQFTSSILLCICLLTITGCGKKTEPKKEPPKPQAVTEQKPKEIIVKGLYIGMPIQSVAAVVREKFGGDWQTKSFNGQERGVYISSERVTKSQKEFTLDDGVAVKSDDSGKVISIGFTPPAVDALFNAYNLQPAQFAKVFMDSYGIDNMEGIKDGWEYVRDDVKVGVTTRKIVFLQKVASRADVQKNFN